MTAALPMYDWPEVRAETDALWEIIGGGLRNLGLPAPEALLRPVDDVWPHWRDPDLVLSQTCGLPYSARLAGDVALLGAPVYDIAETPPGYYRSEIVVRADDAATNVADMAGRRFAYNMPESQSGYACVKTQIGDPADMFDLVETGAHRASVVAVAEGRADVAAIDAVAWALAQRHEPAAQRLRVIARTAPTPGLPLITAPRDEAMLSLMRLVIETAIETAPTTVRKALLLTGFVKKRREDYAPLVAGWPA